VQDRLRCPQYLVYPHVAGQWAVRPRLLRAVQDIGSQAGRETHADKLAQIADEREALATLRGTSHDEAGTMPTNNVVGHLAARRLIDERLYAVSTVSGDPQPAGRFRSLATSEHITRHVTALHQQRTPPWASHRTWEASGPSTLPKRSTVASRSPEPRRRMQPSAGIA
jgi:hypothetical protein